MIIGWDARRESGRLSLLIDEEKATTDPSERFEKNKREKNKKEKEEGTGIYIRCYRENFIVVGDRTTVAQLSSTRVRPRFHFFFFFSPPSDASFSCPIEGMLGTSSAPTMHGESRCKLHGTDTEKTRPDEYSRLFEPRPWPLLAIEDIGSRSNRGAFHFPFPLPRVS